MTISEGTVIVTGATRGIGRATVAAILARGGRVVALARNEEALAELEASAPDRIRTVTADLSDVAQVADVARRAIEAFGVVDGLVNCAGIAHHEPIAAATVESIETQFRVNLTAPLLLSQAVAGHLAGREGAIVNVSSTLSERVVPTTVVYAATKAALNRYSEGLAHEVWRLLILDKIREQEGMAATDDMVANAQRGVLESRIFRKWAEQGD